MSPDDTTSENKRERKAAYMKAYREENRERLAKSKAEYDKSHRESRHEQKAASDKAWRDANKERKNASDKKWRAENKERDAANHRAYYEANMDKIKARTKAWNNDNFERLRERRNATSKAWGQANPERSRARASRYRTRKRGFQFDFSPDNWKFALDYFGGCCAVCGRPPGFWHTLAQDHWIPITSPECPGTVAWNIVPLCHGTAGCNNSKINKPAAEWLYEKFGKRKGHAILRKIEAFLDSRRSAS